MNSEHSRIKKHVAIELCLLAVLALAFLLVFPQRPIVVDVGLAVVAVTLLFFNIPYTSGVIWRRFPATLNYGARLQKTILLVGPVTAIVVTGLLAAGVVLGYLEDGLNGAVRRVVNWHMLAAFALYVPWALLQQTLFQFYLLGRLLTLFPATLAIPCTGIIYALVHLPCVDVTLATAVAGVFWTYVYYRYRVLWPLAFSHALFGSTFYYWVNGRDLVGAWIQGS